MTMATLSERQAARSRKNLTAVLRAFQRTGQTHVAKALELDDATITREMAKLDRFCTILAVLELKVVPEGVRCFDPKEIEPLLALARQRMEHLTVEQLRFDDTDIQTGLPSR